MEKELSMNKAETSKCLTCGKSTKFARPERREECRSCWMKRIEIQMNADRRTR